MTDAIITVGTYLMILIMIFYTIGAFLALRYENVQDMNAIYYLLNFLIFLFNGCGFAIILIHERELVLIGFYAAQLAFLFLYLLIYRKLYPRANPVLLNHMMMFLSLGFIMLTRLKPATAYRQFALTVFAAVITLIVPKMFSKLKAARMWGAITGIIGLLLLVAVLVLGKAYQGAILSIRVGPVLVQPSEFVKISFVLLLAVLFRQRQDIKRILFGTAITLAHVGVLILSRDLGAATIYAMAFLMILYVVTRNPLVFVAGAVGGAAAVFAAYHLFTHVRNRFQAWINPWPLFQNQGAQVGNSLFGIATGGWFGRGLYRGKPRATPLVDTDFIFSAICEEMGGIVGICVILMCIACLLMFIHVAADLYLPFYKLIGIGLATIYGTQVLLHIGGVIKFIPSTGVTLPFVSYGGSSLLSTFIIFGIMHELYIKQQNEVERIEQAR